MSYSLYVHYTAKGYQKYGILRGLGDYSQSESLSYNIDNSKKNILSKLNLVNRANTYCEKFEEILNALTYPSSFQSSVITPEKLNQFQNKINDEMAQRNIWQFISYEEGRGFYYKVESKQGFGFIIPSQGDKLKKELEFLIQSLQKMAQRGQTTVQDIDNKIDYFNMLKAEIDSVIAAGEKNGYYVSKYSQTGISGKEIDLIQSYNEAISSILLSNELVGSFTEYIVEVACQVAVDVANEAEVDLFKQIKSIINSGNKTITRSGPGLHFDLKSVIPEIKDSDRANTLAKSIKSFSNGTYSFNAYTSTQTADVEMSINGGQFGISVKDSSSWGKNDIGRIQLYSGSAYYPLALATENFVSHFLNLSAQLHKEKNNDSAIQNPSGTNTNIALEFFKKLIAVRGLTGMTSLDGRNNQGQADILLINARSKKRWYAYDTSILSRKILNESLKSSNLISTTGTSLHNLRGLFKNKWASSANQRIAILIGQLEGLKVTAYLNSINLTK